MRIEQNIENSLSGRMLGHAFALLKPIVAESKDDDLKGQLKQLTAEYQSVCDNFLSGGDNEASGTLDDLVRLSFLFADEVLLNKRMRESTSYEVRELLKPLPLEHSGLSDLFRYFYLAKLKEIDIEEVQLFIQEKATVKALLAISAITLNVLRQFSVQNIIFLLRLCTDDKPQEVRERAWVGLILLLIKYDTRLPFFTEIQEELQDLLLDEDGQVFAATAFTCIVRTLGVDWANNSYDSIQKQIAPWVAKMMPKGKNGSSGSDDEKKTLITADLDDFAAQFGDEFKDMLEERRQEMIKMQEQHLDTHFAMTRSMYSTSFFSEPYKWWLPFDEDLLNEDEQKAYELTKKIPIKDLCDSDRYAFISAVSHVGIVNKDNEVMRLEDMPDSDEETTDMSDNLLCNGYVKQAYRFFRLNPWQFQNIFDLVNNIPSTLVFRLINPTAQSKYIIANQCLRCHAFSAAAEIYQMVVGTIATAEAYRNYALSLQKTEQYEQAIANYKVAVEKEQHPWALRQMVFCYNKLENYAGALEVMQTLLSIRQDDMLYHYQYAKCLERVELYAEALKEYFLIDLKHEGNPKVERSLAWCAFLCDDFDNATLYYDKLQAQDKMKDIDYLNRGHLCFVTGKRYEALVAYQRAMQMHDNLKSFLQDFRPDRHFLLEKGISKSDIYMMEDQLIFIYSQSK